MIERLDRAADPGLQPPRAGLGAFGDHLQERAVDANFQPPGPDRPRQAARHMETVERQHPPGLGIDQVDAVVQPRLGHREDALPIALDQVLGGEGEHPAAVTCDE